MLNSAVSKAPTLTKLSWSFHGFSSLFCRFSSLFSLFLLAPSLVVCSSNFQLSLDNSQVLKYPTESFFSFPSLPLLPSQHPHCLCCFSWTLLMNCHLWSAQSCGCWWGAPCSLWISARYVESVVNLHKFCCSQTMQYPSWDHSPVEQAEGGHRDTFCLCHFNKIMRIFLLFWNTLSHCCCWQSTINPLSCCD